MSDTDRLVQFMREEAKNATDERQSWFEATAKEIERLEAELEKIVKMPPYRESQHAMSFMDKFCEAHHIAEEALKD